MFVDAGLSRSEMAHQGVMGFAVLVMAIISVKFSELRLATQPDCSHSRLSEFRVGPIPQTFNRLRAVPCFYTEIPAMRS